MLNAGALPLVEILLLFLLAVIFAVFSAMLAGCKGYDQAGWALAGFLFGPIALLTAMGLPDLKLRKYIRLLAEHQGAVVVEAPTESAAQGKEDADAQRRRILGRR
jgi:hypothetical protein